MGQYHPRGLQRQPVDWLVMTWFFDMLCSKEEIL